LSARWAKVVENNGDYMVDLCCVSLLKNKFIVEPEKNAQNLCFNGIYSHAENEIQ
jgi:hypothetical protein